MEKGERRTHTSAAQDGALVMAHSLHVRTVIVLISWNAECDRTLDKRIADLARPFVRRDRQFSRAPSIAVVACTETSFRAHEIGQDVPISPTLVAELRPCVEIQSQSAIVDGSVHGTRTSEGFPLSKRDTAPVSTA